MTEYSTMDGGSNTEHSVLTEAAGVAGKALVREALRDQDLNDARLMLEMQGFCVRHEWSDKTRNEFGLLHAYFLARATLR